MPVKPEDEYLSEIRRFLHKIGIPTELKSLQCDTFLPGILLEYGGLAIDPEKLLSVGDLLHEAGHIACMPPSKRVDVFAYADEDQAEEICSQAWSYAAAIAIGIPPEVVFHTQGYKGDAEALLNHYKEGGQNGAPLLAWFDMTSFTSYNKPVPEEECFPNMRCWIRLMDDPEAYWRDQMVAKT